MSTMKAPAPTGTLLAPPPNWQEHEHRAHVAQFYAADDFLLDSLSRFVGTALDAGDSAVVLATELHRAGLASRLQGRGLDMAAAIRQGRYMALDAAATLSKFMRDGWPDAARFADVAGGLIARARSAAEGKNSRVVIFGEMVGLLWAKGESQAAMRLEQLWNDLGKTHSFSLRCGYPIKGFHRAEDGEPFLKICQEHSVVIPVESYAALASETERLQDIARLQQRAQALENEVAERKRAEGGLRRAHDELEQRVTERTAELERKNLQILQQAEILEATNQGLRQLSARLLRVQDDERRRIARDLHDSTGQTLALLGMNLSALEAHAQKVSPDFAKAVSENAAIVQQVTGELRTMSYLLHPPLLDEIGLESALHWYVEGFGQRSGIAVSLELTGDLGRLPRDLETAIFRVVQECLTNIHRHSGSPTAAIRLSRSSGSVTFEVEDAGKGLGSEMVAKVASSGTPGLGLRGMRERIQDFQGTFEIVSEKKGTHIKVVIPIPATEPEVQVSGSAKASAVGS